MAFFEMRYHSDALKQGVSVNVIIPESAKTLIGMQASGEGSYKTLYLLHGLSDDHTIWMRRTSIERYAAEHGIAVVMPAVTRSWYTDTAYGAMMYYKDLPPVERIVQTFRTLEKMRCTKHFPVVIMNTMTKDRIVIYK